MKKDIKKGGVYLYMDIIHLIEMDIKKEGGVYLYMDTIYQIYKDIKKGGYTSIWIQSTI